MKKVLAILLAVALIFTLAACGGGTKGKLIGKWELVDTTDAENSAYGLGIEFKKDGTLTYGLTEELLALSGSEDVNTDDYDEALGYLMKIEYKIKSDTQMEIKVSAMFGLASEKAMVDYSLDGDTLVFDGATYRRVK